MKNESENPFKLFITEKKKYEDMWDAIEMKVVAIKRESNNYILGMHATLLANVTPMSEILLDLEDIIMLHEVRTIARTELNDIINGLEKGLIKIDEKELTLNGVGRFDFGHISSHRREALEVDWDWPYFWLRAIGNNLVRGLINEDKINTGLNEWGYEDLRNACEENLGFMVGGAYAPHIYLTAPILHYC